MLRANLFTYLEEQRAEIAAFTALWRPTGAEWFFSRYTILCVNVHPEHTLLIRLS